MVSPKRVVQRAALAALALVVLAGCQLRTELLIDVHDDGTGVVELGVALDDAALEREPTVLETLDVDDLIDAGWEVTGPAREADDLTWVRARHRFDVVDEIGPLVDQVAGADGPFRDFEVVIDSSLLRRQHRFTGTVDFSSGAAAVVADDAVDEAVGADTIDLLEERFGAAIDEAVEVRVGVRLPGDVESNAVTQAGNGALWQPSVTESEPVELAATGTVERTARLAWLLVASATVVVLVGFVVARAVIALVRRRRSSPPDDAA